MLLYSHPATTIIALLPSLSTILFFLPLFLFLLSLPTPTLFLTFSQVPKRNDPNKQSKKDLQDNMQPQTKEPALQGKPHAEIPKAKKHFARKQDKKTSVDEPTAINQPVRHLIYMYMQ